MAAEDYQGALEFADKSLAFNDRHLSTLRAKIIALHFLDRGDEARAAGADLMRRQPDFRLNEYAKAHPSAGREIGQRAYVALKAAGVPLG